MSRDDRELELRVPGQVKTEGCQDNYFSEI